ncbi:hypothetical protein KBY23_17095, partial [Ruegeria pomeroyi]|nr:hypothetical protein [Ruegeria pomeroyi]
MGGDNSEPIIAWGCEKSVPFGFFGKLGAFKERYHWFQKFYAVARLTLDKGQLGTGKQQLRLTRPRSVESRIADIGRAAIRGLLCGDTVEKLCLSDALAADSILLICRRVA